MDRTAQIVPAPDGRTLSVAEWGDPTGTPVVALHGTPGCRLNRPADEAAVAGLGVRLITYDRAGYGRSDRHHGRSVADCVGDVEAIVDALGIDRFYATGGSGGGPHVLAVAARLPDRVVRARCAVGIAPYDAADIDFLAGMDPLNVKEFGFALEGEEAVTAHCEAEAAADVARVAQDPSKVLSDEWEIPAADRAVLADPRVQQVFAEALPETFVRGVSGWVDDDLAFTRPWGFDVSEIRVPCEVRYGADDVLVPAAHGAWLGRHVPGARVVVEKGQGHLAGPAQQVALLEELLRGW